MEKALAHCKTALKFASSSLASFLLDYLLFLLFHAVLSPPSLLPGTAPVVLLASAGAVLAERLCAFGLERFLRPRNADSGYLTPTCF